MIKALLSFIPWIAKSFGASNEVSARRLTAFDITVLYTITALVYIWRVKDPYWMCMALALHALFVLLLFGIVTFQQIIELKNGSNPPKND